MDPEQHRLTEDYREQSKEYGEFYKEHWFLSGGFGLGATMAVARRDELYDRVDIAYDRLRDHWWEGTLPGTVLEV